MRMRILFLLAIECAALLAISCLSPDKLFAETPSSSKLPTLRIGVVLPLTGDFAQFGIDVQRGMILAQEELRSRSVPVELLFEDTQYVPRLAASAAQQLLTTHRVHALVSLWDTAEAVAPIAERAKVPHFSLRWNPQVAEQYSHTFTFESTYITWVREVLSLIASENARTVSLLTDSSASAWIMARESFLQQASAAGIVVVNDVQFMGARDDLKPAITKLLAKPGEYIVMLHYQPTIGDAMKRLQSLPLTTPVTGFFEGLEESVNLEGRRFVSQFDTQPWFYEKFYRRYPKEKPIKAAFGYDLTMILGQTLHHTQRLPTSNEIITSLSRLHDYHGATGTISSNSRRNIETTCVRKIIKNGRAELINPARVNSEKNE